MNQQGGWWDFVQPWAELVVSVAVVAWLAPTKAKRVLAVVVLAGWIVALMVINGDLMRHPW